MGEVSGISWTDATFNPWWGCTRVSPGCERCYAETLATTRHRLPVWGVDAPRKAMSDAYWRDPIKWDRRAGKEGVRRRVFCASMADVFEIPPVRNVPANLVINDGRRRLFELIASTPNLDWLLLTKRPENVVELIPPAWSERGWPRNVWLGVTAEDRRRARERVSILVDIPARVRFVSHEPALEGVDLSQWLGAHGVHWVITGGESGMNARAYHLEWADDIIEQCRAANVAPFVKQLGANPRHTTRWQPYQVAHKKGADPAEWPQRLQVQEFPQ